MPSAADLAAKREAEKKQIEAVMAQCSSVLATMVNAQPAEADRIKTRLNEMIKACPKLPLDFKRELLVDARNFECESNTRAAHAALQMALHKARYDDVPERNRLVAEARNFCRKAASLGANREFTSAVARKIEIITMTGHVEHHGPTVAKPLYATPKNPHNPKA